MKALALLVKGIDFFSIRVVKALLREVLFGGILNLMANRNLILNPIFLNIVDEMVMSMGRIVVKIDEKEIVGYEFYVDVGVVEP